MCFALDQCRRLHGCGFVPLYTGRIVRQEGSRIHRRSFDIPLIVNFPSEEERTRSIWLEAALDGCVFYDTDLLLSGLFIDIRNLIASRNIERRFACGVPCRVKGGDGKKRENIRHE